MDQTQARRKIETLLAIARRHSGAGEGERRTAFEKARALSEAHGIAIGPVDAHAPEPARATEPPREARDYASSCSSDARGAGEEPKVKATPKTPAMRCSFCHDEMAEMRFVCPGCWTAMHRDCFEENGCPTPGCPTRFKPEPDAPTRGWERFGFRAEPSPAPRSDGGRAPNGLNSPGRSIWNR